MNEAMLTGESIPVIKTPISTNTQKYNVEQAHTLFAGTKCIKSQ